MASGVLLRTGARLAAGAEGGLPAQLRAAAGAGQSRWVPPPRPRAPAPPRAQWPDARSLLDLLQEGEGGPGRPCGGEGEGEGTPLPPFPHPTPSPPLFPLPLLLFGEARLPDHEGPTATTRRLAGWTSRRRSSRGPGGRRG